MSWGCKTNCSGNGPSMSPSAMHQCCVLPMICARRELCILLPCIQGGASGYQLQSYGPFSASYAEIDGLTCDAWSRFSVSCTCGASLSHSWRGNQCGDECILECMDGAFRHIYSMVVRLHQLQWASFFGENLFDELRPIQMAPTAQSSRKK